MSLSFRQHLPTALVGKYATQKLRVPSASSPDAHQYQVTASSITGVQLNQTITLNLIVIAH